MFDFSTTSQAILRDIGWFAERKVDINPWVNQLQQDGYRAFDISIQLLEHLGGLDSNDASKSRKPVHLLNNSQVFFATHPGFDFIAIDTPDSDQDSAALWIENSFIKQNNLDIFPIGSIRGITTLFVVSDGRIFEGQFYAPRNYKGEKQPSLKFLGNTIAEAVNTLTEKCIAYV